MKLIKKCAFGLVLCVTTVHTASFNEALLFARQSARFLLRRALSTMAQPLEELTQTLKPKGSFIQRENALREYLKKNGLNFNKPEDVMVLDDEPYDKQSKADTDRFSEFK